MLRKNRRRFYREFELFSLIVKLIDRWNTIATVVLVTSTGVNSESWGRGWGTQGTDIGGTVGAMGGDGVGLIYGVGGAPSSS